MTSDSKKYRLSVVIPAYNAGRYLGRAIDSVLAQTTPADEVIVIDDGSTDSTAEVAGSYGEKIRFIRQANAGPSAARNTGINAAQCEWIAFLDADDEWLPEKLARQIDILKRNTGLSWVTGNYIRCLCSENRTAPDVTERQCQRALSGKDYFDDYLAACRKGFTGSTDNMLIKKTLLHQAGLFRQEYVNFEDLDLWLKIAYLKPQIGFDPKPMSIYHLNIVDSVSQRQKKAALYRAVIHRHLAFAGQENRLDAFRPFAACRMRRWLRAMFFDGQENNVRPLVREFGFLFPAWYRLVMFLLTIKPGLTAAGCHAISKIVRAFNLRRRAVRRPAKGKKTDA